MKIVWQEEVLELEYLEEREVPKQNARLLLEKASKKTLLIRCGSDEAVFTLDVPDCVFATLSGNGCRAQPMIGYVVDGRIVTPPLTNIYMPTGFAPDTFSPICMGGNYQEMCPSKLARDFWARPFIDDGDSALILMCRGMRLIRSSAKFMANLIVEKHRELYEFRTDTDHGSGPTLCYPSF